MDNITLLVAEGDGTTFGAEWEATIAEVRAANAEDADTLAALDRLARRESSEEVVAGFTGVAFRFRRAQRMTLREKVHARRSVAVRIARTLLLR